LDTLINLKNKIEAQQKEIQDFAKNEGAKAFSEAAKVVFEKAPTLGVVMWVQYTPYFNDGDSCEFSVNEIAFHSKGLVAAGKHLSPYEGDIYLASTYADTLKAKTDKEYTWVDTIPSSEEEWKALSDFESLISGLEEVLLAVFGDHQKITLHSDGKVEIEDYDHD